MAMEEEFIIQVKEENINNNNREELSFRTRFFDYLNNLYQKNIILILIFLSFLLISKSPDFLFIPRIYADELFRFRIFFNNELSFLEKLFYFCPESARQDIALNLSALIQTYFKLEYGAYISAWFSFSFYIVVFIFFLTRPLILSFSPVKRILLCIFIIIFFYDWDDHMILSMALIQHVLGVLTVAILISNSNKLNWLQNYLLDNLILLFCGLSGGYSNFLTPLFYMKLLHRRRIADIVKTLVITITTIIQVYSAYITSNKEFLTEARGIYIPLLKRLNENLYPVICKPFIGFLEFSTIGIPNVYMLSIIIFLSLLLIFDLKKIRENTFIFTMFLFCFMGCSLGASQGILKGRYASLVIFFILIYILENFNLEFKNNPSNNKSIFFFYNVLQKLTCILLLLLALVTGFTIHTKYKSSFMYNFISQSPYWIEDVRNWKTYPNYVLTPVKRSYPVDLLGKHTVYPIIEIGKNYKVKKIVPWLDYYQLKQQPFNGDKKEYIEFSCFRFVIKITEKGIYNLQGCFYSKFKNTIWLVKVETRKGFKTLFSGNWHIYKTEDWTWQTFPKNLTLEPGEYVITMIPMDKSPVTEISVVQGAK